MITIEIDGKKIQARPGEMLIDVADKAGIEIPRFCYHNKLSIAANCRMCLVDVEKAPKPLPACATSAADGMVVHTQSEKAINNQKSVMELLLINHPLDCPICDQGGECELQDVAVKYGSDVGRYSEQKRILPHKNAGPLISMDMTRCIHCTRCVRFGQEVAGDMELGLSGRNDHVQITTYLENNITSELSGNVIDICPVGALTSRPFRFSTRTWELQSHASISTQDIIGANTFVHTKNNKIYRIVPRQNEQINEVWLADRDRFCYEGNTVNRLTSPMQKIKGKWFNISWEDAFDLVGSNLIPMLAETQVLFSDCQSAEEMYLINKLVNQSGMFSSEYRLLQQDITLDNLGNYAPGMKDLDLEALENIEAAFIIGCNLRKQLPLLNLRIRKAVINNGAQIFHLNPAIFDLNYEAEAILCQNPKDWQATLTAVLELVQTDKKQKVKATDSDTEKFAKAFCNVAKKDTIILLGDIVQCEQNYGNIAKLAAQIAEISGCRLMLLPRGGNSVYAASTVTQTSKTSGNKPRATLLVGIEPKLDISEKYQQSVEQSDYVVSISSHDSVHIRRVADVILPAATTFESGGSHVNITHSWQTARAVVTPPGEAREVWKILRVLANTLQVKGFDYVNLSQITEEAKQSFADSKTIGADVLAKAKLNKPTEKRKSDTQLVKLYSPYSVNALLRNSKSLQQTQDAEVAEVRVNPASTPPDFDSAEQSLAIEQDDIKRELLLVSDDKVAEGIVFIPGGQADLAGFSNGDCKIKQGTGGTGV